MRRIIAEDPEWNLATVPQLDELCLKHIIGNFDSNPLLQQLLPRHKTKVLSNLAVNIPLLVTANLITDENYWQRCCKTRWMICDVSLYKNSWKRMFFEKNLEEIIEKFVPGSDQFKLIETLQLSKDYIRCLDIKQLLPPIKEPAIFGDDDFSDSESDIGDIPSCDHFDFNLAIEMLPKLEELHLTYGVKDCGMNFEWNLFEFTSKDCSLLAKAIKNCSNLRVFHLHKSKVNDEKARILISHLLDHPTVEILNLSYNKLSDSSARAFGKLLNGHSILTELDLSDNQISFPGGAAIGHALGKNTTLKKLNLRLNRLQDEGCQSLCRALLKNTTLTHLNVGSNNIGVASAPLIGQVLVYNKVLTSFNLSCNKLDENGGKTIQEGMEDNTTITDVDLRLTEIGQECEYCVNQLLKNNREAIRKSQM